MKYNPRTDSRFADGYIRRETRGGDYGVLVTWWHEACGQRVIRYSAGNRSGYAYASMDVQWAKKSHVCPTNVSPQ